MLQQQQLQMKAARADVQARRSDQPHVHGTRLVCFRPRERYRHVDTSSAATDLFEHIEHADAIDVHGSDSDSDSDCGSTQRLSTAHTTACDCSVRVLPCALPARAHRSSVRIAAWRTAFAALDVDVSPINWRNERISQTWRFASSSSSSSLLDDAPTRHVAQQFDALLRQGIRPPLRGRIWFHCTGAATKQHQASQTYALLLSKRHLLSPAAAMEIEKDLPRTFPLDFMHRPHATSELRRVLQAYSLYNPSIGYCQSMNFIAALLLTQLHECEAFWTLAAIVEDLMPHFHTHEMVGSRTEQRVLSDLVTAHLPELAAHLVELQVDFAPFTLKWFLCLFVHTLPLHLVLRVWDVLLCHGSWVLLRVALVLLQLFAPQIRACSDAFDVYALFHTVDGTTLDKLTLPYRVTSDKCVCDTFLRLVMEENGAIPIDSLLELRAFYAKMIAVEVEDDDDARRVAAAAKSSRHAHISRQATALAVENDALELLEYDFLDELTIDEVDEDALIHFHDVYDSSSSSDDSSSYTTHRHRISSSDPFVDVQFESARVAVAVQHTCR